jgi:hypothetical protein
MARFGWRRFAGMFSSDPAVHRNSFVCLRSLALLSPVCHSPLATCERTLCMGG